MKTHSPSVKKKDTTQAELVGKILEEWAVSHDKNQKLWNEIKRAILLGLIYIMFIQLFILAVVLNIATKI